MEDLPDFAFFKQADEPPGRVAVTDLHDGKFTARGELTRADRV